MPRLPDQRSTLDSSTDDWDRHWSQYASAAVLNPAQDFRRRLILRALAVDRPGARILDIGSGSGDLAADLVEELPAPEVRGLELSATGVEIARRKVPEAEFRKWNLLVETGVPDEDAGWADFAVCSEVLEHVDDPVALLRNARPFLASGCRLVITVPGGPMSAFDRHIGHRRHFRPADAATTLRAAGYRGRVRPRGRVSVLQPLPTRGDRRWAPVDREPAGQWSAAQSRDSNGSLGVRTVDETQHRGTQAGVPDDRGRAHAGLTVTDASSPSAPAGGSTRRVDVDLVIRIVAALLAAGAICGLALTLYPDDLSVSTDVLGYPIFRDFNSGRYTFEYLLIVVAFPAIAIAIFSALEVLARRRVGRRAVPGLPTVAVTDESTPIPTAGRSRRGVLRQTGRRRSPDRGDDRDRCRGIVELAARARAPDHGRLRPPRSRRRRRHCPAPSAVGRERDARR